MQQRLVADEREQTNVLVLAGPGSGKTRVLVHRIAYLVRVKRENPRGILALAYNRHAAAQIRRRLADLIGDDAKGVVVLTCHALAMRLAGFSFASRARKIEPGAFDQMLAQAVALLKGEGLPPDEADEQRERLLAGFRWILVDEYQDIGPGQYELIAALVGRSLEEEDRKLSLFAVGDDDQNIYAFDGASVEFIRRFETEYAAKAAFLTENYRSTAHIVSTANRLIAQAPDRMKTDHPIAIDRARAKAPPGGDWQKIDPVGKGRVQILPAGTNPISQAMAAMTELERLIALSPEHKWTNAAVIAREWKYLEPIRSYCELHGIPVQMADEEAPHFWRLRETQALVTWLLTQKVRLIDTPAIEHWLGEQPASPWIALLHEAVAEYALETGAAELPTGHFIEWLAEWGREVRRRQNGLLLATAHRAKGLEFDHVVVLDGGWDQIGRNEDRDAPRRLYYVAMTRARNTLTLARFDGAHALLDALPDGMAIIRRERTSLPTPPPELSRQYARLSLGDVDLGFAGRSEKDAAVHRAIATLKPGSPLELKLERERWALLNETGDRVGRLARAYSPPQGMRCIKASVAAIIVREKEDSQPEYRDQVRCERWEVVVPDVVFAPELK